jgi:hypothetical protein
MTDSVVREFLDQNKKHHSWSIFCPACQCCHGFDNRWKFNGNMDKPTFTPSMLVHENKDYREVSKSKHGHRCHSFVANGEIKYLDDCTHDMKNTTVKLEPF